ncbi:MAG TPA: helix-turn-helix transcriptional regulator [Candidatus Acidoferrales bacterium]|nr:helix-turn-helix transcriptional regulator [Candidatus Acidoferrales bacterium]
MIVERHLILQELNLASSAEWVPSCQGWMMVRVAEGTGYWLPHGAAHRQLNPGDGLMVVRNGGGVVRASWLSPLKLQFFTVQLQYLNGILTVAEWQQLEVAPNHPDSPASVFTAGEPIGQKFMRLADQTHSHRLSLRCALLQLWASAVAGLLPATESLSPSGNKLRDHLRELVGQMTEAELSERSLPELARQLNCSERHFSRLFREEFAAPFHARQIELRLQRARQLLSDSNAKIINVANVSGYRHLGLFNAMFKKRFGLTPAEWRRQQPQKGPSGSQPGHFFPSAERAGAGAGASLPHPRP